ncbi:hypothetical protein [Tateyamaria omphalii]|nr:hypothetical protein [Tateyamaria omphalii]
MPPKTISYPVRHTREVAEEIDAIAASNGFGTRAKFMVHAALNYKKEDDEAVAVELARISFALRQLDRAETGRVHLLKRRNIREIERTARAALTAVIERNVG